MLELDLILLSFFEKQFPHLAEAEQEVFVQLLDEEDPVLASWLFGPDKPANPDFSRLIFQIKRSRFNGLS